MFLDRFFENKNLMDFPSVLKTDGLTRHDFDHVSRLQRRGFPVFMHGSGVTANKLNSGSDIDLAVVGDLTQLPSQLKNQFFSKTPHEVLKNIDYTSVSFRAKNGRKISLHLQNPHFRGNYLSRPYAVEYRTRENLKSSLPSNYILGGVDKDGISYIFSITCPQFVDTHGTYNIVPQTGVFTVSGEKAIPAQGTEMPEFGITCLGVLDKGGSVMQDQKGLPSELMVLGLELNKMSEDIVFGSTQKHHEEMYVKKPLRDTLRAIENYSGTDPVQILVNCLQGRADIRMRRDGRKRLTNEYIQAFIMKMASIQEPALEQKRHGRFL